mmetsp:Transcript_22382/g.32060  ORF Transcript_22382/g.32060 Transcript_22382/m.32060 type:complete len:125 (-) Transcript_22382:3469-3843(-)
MVKQWGMSDKIGPIALDRPESGGPFMGRAMGQRQTHWGSKILSDVDGEVERMVNNAYVLAKEVLTVNRALLDNLAKVLIEQETVSAEEFQMMLVEYGTKTVDFGVFGQERSREKLPFQTMPLVV